MDWFDASTAGAAPTVTTSTLASSTVASLGGYAQADPTLVGVVVAAIAMFSVVYVLKRVLGERRAGRTPRSQSGVKPARERSR